MKKRALLIGINKYQTLGKLSYAREDAEAFAKMLHDHYDFSDHDVSLMTCGAEGAGAAFSRYIELALSDLTDCKDLELLVFGFWGHGFAPQPGRRYLCGLDTIDKDLERTAVSMDVVRAKLSQTGAENTLMVLDCCQNRPAGRAAGAEALTRGEEGTLSEMARDIQAAPRKKTRHTIPTVAVLNSCREGQRAYEWEQRRHGIFTAHLIDRMSEGASSIAHLASSIFDPVTRTAMDLHRQTQTPFVVIEGKGDISLPLINAGNFAPSGRSGIEQDGVATASEDMSLSLRSKKGRAAVITVLLVLLVIGTYRGYRFHLNNLEQSNLSESDRSSEVLSDAISRPEREKKDVAVDDDMTSEETVFLETERQRSGAANQRMEAESAVGAARSAGADEHAEDELSIALDAMETAEGYFESGDFMLAAQYWDQTSTLAEEAEKSVKDAEKFQRWKEARQQRIDDGSPRVIILPFDTRGETPGDIYSEAPRRYLERLFEDKNFTVLDDREVNRALDTLGNDRSDGMQSMARMMNADVIISGSVLEINGVERQASAGDIQVHTLVIDGSIRIWSINPVTGERIIQRRFEGGNVERTGPRVIADRGVAGRAVSAILEALTEDEEFISNLLQISSQ